MDQGMRKRSKRSSKEGDVPLQLQNRSEVEALAKQVEALAERLVCWKLGEKELDSKLVSTFEALLAHHTRLCALRTVMLTQHSNEDEDEDEDGYGHGAAGLDSLSPHLQITILALLPIQKIVQLRAVCKSWNSLLQSHALIQHQISDPLPGLDAENWLVMSRKCECAPFFKLALVYITSQQRLFPMPGLDHPRVATHLGYRASRVAFGITCNNECNIYPMICASGAGGLLCCLVTEAQHTVSLPEHGRCCWSHFSKRLSNCCKYSVVVFNPLTGAAHTLPSPPTPKIGNTCMKFPVAELSMHSQNGIHYHVAIRYYGYTKLLIFNSMSGSWKFAPADWKARCGALQCLTEGDIFYWDYKRYSEFNWLYFYSLRRDLWSKIRLSPLWLGNPYADAWTDHSNAAFLKCGTRILLAAPLVDNLHDAQTSLVGNLHDAQTSLGFAVWHLMSASQAVTATLLSFTPMKELQKELPRIVCGCDVHKEVPRFSFTTNGTHICMTGANHIVYDLVGDCWYRPPNHDDSLDYVGLSCFQPRLHANPFPPVTNKWTFA